MVTPIRGRTRPAPVVTSIAPAPQKINAKLNASIHNRFDIEVVDAATGEVRQRAQAENVICTNFWTGIFRSGSYYDTTQYVQVGTGSGTPASSDTALFAYAGYFALSERDSADTSVSNDTTNYVYAIKRLATISETSLVDSAISEIGISASTSGSIMTHAMIKDANGNTITINKTSTDIIRVYATVFIHYAKIVNDGWTVVSYDKNPLFFWMIGTMSIYGNGNGSETKLYLNNSAYVYGTFAFDASTKILTFTALRVAATDCNYTGGTKSMQIALRIGSYIDTHFTTMLPAAWYAGSDITGEAIGTGDGSTTTFATDFIHATNATIYVNGVAASGVTVTDESSVTNNITFATAPASGAVITADYHTSVIAKDANHVFDLTVTLNFGEYTA